MDRDARRSAFLKCRQQAASKNKQEAYTGAAKQLQKLTQLSVDKLSSTPSFGDVLHRSSSAATF